MKMSHRGLFSTLGTLAFLFAASIGLSGCFNDHYVLASTATSLGVELSQNPATQSPQAKFGYQRAEIAYVPSNRFECEDKDGSKTTTLRNCSGGDGAKDVADVLMELKYTGIFSGGEGSGLYQRLAVGSEAVKQPGAAFMMVKSQGGEISPAVANAISSAYIASYANGVALGTVERIQLSNLADELMVNGKFDDQRFSRIVDAAYPPASHPEINSDLKGIVPIVNALPTNMQRDRLRGLLIYYDRYKNPLLTAAANTR